MAPLMCPSLNSAGVRTSTNVAPSAKSALKSTFGPNPNKFLSHSNIISVFI